MWPTIDRARRRLGGASAMSDDQQHGPARAAEADDAADPTAIVEDTVIYLGPVELDQLRTALTRHLGGAVDRPDTPARLEQAIELILADRGAPGHPRVVRRPAGISTPECWEVHLEGVDPASDSAIRDAGRSGAFTA